MGKFGKRFIASLLVFAALIVVALVVAPQFIPVDTLKQQIIAQGEAATGRKITVGGNASIRLIPSIQLTLEDVHVSNPAVGFAKGDIISLKKLYLSLDFFALLTGNVAIDKFELEEPVITLEKLVNGKTNWELPEQPEKKAGADDPSSPGFVRQINVPELTITQGKITYKEAGKEPVSLSKLDVKLQAPSLTDKAKIEIKTLYGNVPVTARMEMDSPQHWKEGKPVDLQVETELDAPGGKTTSRFKGTVEQPQGSRAAQGELAVDSASLKALGKALNMVILPDALNGEGKLQLTAKLDYADPKISLSALHITLDSLKLNGSVAATLGQAVPGIIATLESPGVLVVNDLLAPAPMAGKATAREEQAPARSQGWSAEPILADTAFLKSANADVTLTLGGIKYDTVTLGQVTLRTELKNGTLALNIPEFAFYDGKARMNMTLAAPKNVPVITQQASLMDIDMGRFLRELNGFDKLDGKGSLSFTVNAQGVSQKDLVQALNGSGTLKMRDGAIKGINIAETIRNAKSLLTGGQKTAANTGLKTDFAEMGGSFTITQGVVKNQDFLLKAPLLTVTGEGTVDLPPQRVDYRIKTALVNTLQGQDRMAPNAGNTLTVPFRVTGTFDSLSFMPDMENVVKDVLKDPKAAKETLKEGVKDIKNLLKGF